MIPVVNDMVDLGTARRTLIPKRGGKPISPSTVARWIRKGINGVRLSVIYVGATPYVDQQRLRVFFESVTEARLRKLRTDEPTLLVATDDELQKAGLL